MPSTLSPQDANLRNLTGSAAGRGQMQKEKEQKKEKGSTSSFCTGIAVEPQKKDHTDEKSP